MPKIQVLIPYSTGRNTSRPLFDVKIVLTSNTDIRVSSLEELKRYYIGFHLPKFQIEA